MGCCGCSNKSSAITAGIFGLIQGFVALILNCYFLTVYTTYPENLTWNNLDDRLFLLFATREAYHVIKILLVLAVILNSVWVISSITLLCGINNDNVCCIRQWVIITSFIIIGDILLPVILIIATLNSFGDVVNSADTKIQAATREQQSLYNYVQDRTSTLTLDLYSQYVILLMTFVKFGLITIIINICLTVFTNRRAWEISNQRGYVMSNPVYLVPGHTVSVHLNQGNPAFPMGTPPQGLTNPTYCPANIALEPTSMFASHSVENRPSDIHAMNKMNELLIPPR